MIRLFAFTSLLLAGLPAMAAAPPLTASFAINRLPPKGAAASVSLRLAYQEPGRNSSNLASVRLSELEGLSPAQLDSGGLRVIHFALRREAGDLACDGTVSGGRASGECRFTAKAAFSDALARHRIPRPTPGQQYELAVHGVRLALIEALERRGYKTPTVDDLIAAGVFEVDPNYIHDLARAGCPVRRVVDLVAFRIHGVTADYVRELAAADRKLLGAEADDIVALRIHRITPEWIRRQAAAGHVDLEAGQLVALRLTGSARRGPR